MPLYGQIAAGIAGALHVVFFLFESVLFKQPKTQKRFHVEPAAAEAVRPWAFNQSPSRSQSTRFASAQSSSSL